MSARPDGSRFGNHDKTGRSSGRIPGRRGARLKPPKGEPWVWLTREVMTSDAWRALGGPGRRLIDFLLIEHMNHAGTMNGRLKTTHRQLEAFGIGTHQITKAIDEVERLDLVDVKRGHQRMANTYRLTFYPLFDGTPATNRWKDYKLQKTQARQLGAKSKNLTVKQQSKLPAKQQSKLTAKTTGARRSAESYDCQTAVPYISTARPVQTTGDEQAAAKRPWTMPIIREVPMDGYYLQLLASAVVETVQ